MKRIVVYTTLALILSVLSVNAQTEERKGPVRAKEPTVVEVKGKRGEVALDNSRDQGEPKKQSAAKRAMMTVVNGVGSAWNSALDWTQKSLGVDDDIAPPKERQAAK